MSRDPFDTFVRECRRVVRATVRELGQVPPKVDMVSRGQNPRKLRVLAVTMRETDPGRRVREMAVENGSVFVGLARLFGPEVEVPDAEPCPQCKGEESDAGPPCATCMGAGTLERLVGLTAFSPTETVTYACRVNPLSGVGAWERAEFRPGDIEGLRAVLFDNWTEVV